MKDVSEKSEKTKNLPETKNPPETKKQNETLNNATQFMRHPLLKYSVSVINGVMFMTISEVGGVKLMEVLHLEGSVANALNHVLSGLGGVVYSTFYYKILDELELKKPTQVSQIILSLLTLITSLSFLEGSVQGSQWLGIPSEIAIPFCIIFFLFRVLACTDSALKFPKQIKEMLQDFKNAWNQKDYKELSRILFSFLTAIGYSGLMGDSIYSAIERIVHEWMKISVNMQLISFISGILGGIGMFPFALNWTYRGIKQISFGGKSEQENKQPDPTDRYTIYAFLCVLPEVMGILGTTIGQQGTVFGLTLSQTTTRIIDVLKIFFSSAYTIAGDIPGMSTLIRTFSNKIKNIPSNFCFNFFEQKKDEHSTLETKGNKIEIV